MRKGDECVCVCHSKLAHIRLSYSEDKLPNNSVAHHIGRLVRGGKFTHAYSPNGSYYLQKSRRIPSINSSLKTPSPS